MSAQDKNITMDPPVMTRAPSLLSVALMTFVVLLYFVASGWCIYEFQRGHLGVVFSLSVTALLFAVVLSALSALIYRRKVRWVRGVERVEEGADSGWARWIEPFGDRGVGLISLTALGVHLPIVFAVNYLLDLELFGYDTLSIFEPGVRGGSELHFTKWLYFIIDHSLPISLSELIKMSERYMLDLGLSHWVEASEGLESRLSVLGKLMMSLMHFGLIALLMRSWQRRKELSMMLQDRMRAVALSAREIDEHERSHLALLSSAIRGQRRAEVLEARKVRLEQLAVQQRALGLFLSVFSKRFLHRTLRGEVRNPSGASVARAAILGAALKASYKRQLFSRGHPFASLAFEVLLTQRSSALRHAALLNTARWASATQKKKITEAARRLMHEGAARSATHLSGLGEERLTLAAVSTLVSQGELSALSVLNSALQNPSGLIRAEARVTFDELARVLSRQYEPEVDLYELFSGLRSYLEALDRGRAGGEGVTRELIEALTAGLSEVRHERPAKDELTQRLTDFMIDLLCSGIGTDLNQTSLITETYQLLSVGAPDRVAQELWGVMSVRRLSRPILRELFEGLIQRASLLNSFLHVAREVIREGTAQERVVTARLLGEMPYHQGVHSALLEELHAWGAYADAGEVLPELICSLGKLCAGPRRDERLTQESVALLTTLSTEHTQRTEGDHRVEVARRYALSFLTERDEFVHLFEWGTRSLALFGDELEVEMSSGSADEREHLANQALALLKKDQPYLELFIERASSLYQSARAGEPFTLDEEALSALRDRNALTQLPEPGADLGVLWVNLLATRTRARPSATGLLLTLGMLNPVFHRSIRQAALRKLKQYRRFLKGAALGPLAHRSLAEWVSLRLTHLIGEGRSSDPIWSSLVLRLGDHPCPQSQRTLQRLLEDRSLTANHRQQVVKALGRQQDGAEVLLLREHYEQTESIVEREGVVQALIQTNTGEAQDTLMELFEQAQESPHRLWNQATLIRLVGYLQQGGLLERAKRLYEQLSAQTPALQVRLLNDYQSSPFGELTLTRQLWADGLEALERDGVPTRLLKAISKVLPTLWERINQLDPHLFTEEERASQSQAVFTALKGVLQGRELTPSELGVITASASCFAPSPVDALRWLEELIQNATLPERSYLIANIETLDPDRFVSIATQHFEEHLNALSFECINRLAEPYLARAGRAAIQHVKPLILRCRDYSPYLVRSLKVYGDPHSDRFWLAELYQEVKQRRVEDQQVLARMEAWLLSTLHSFDDPIALPTLVELALMSADSAAEEELQREAIKVLEGLRDLNDVILINRDEAQ